MEGVGYLIKELRRQLEMSLDELADKTGLSKSYISRIERGKRNITRKAALKLSKPLRVPHKVLLHSGKLLTKKDLDVLIEIISDDISDLDFNEKNKLQAKIREKISKKYTFYRPVPVLEKIEKNNSIIDKNNIKYFEKLPKNEYGKSLFFLLVQNNDMENNHIIKNDLVLVRKSPHFNDGELVVLNIQKDDAVIRKVFGLENDKYLLQTANPDVEQKTINRDKVRICGVCTEVRRKLKTKNFSSTK